MKSVKKAIGNFSSPRYSDALYDKKRESTDIQILDPSLLESDQIPKIRRTNSDGDLRTLVFDLPTSKNYESSPTLTKHSHITVRRNPTPGRTRATSETALSSDSLSPRASKSVSPISKVPKTPEKKKPSTPIEAKRKDTPKHSRNTSYPIPYSPHGERPSTVRPSKLKSKSFSQLPSGDTKDSIFLNDADIRLALQKAEKNGLLRTKSGSATKARRLFSSSKLNSTSGEPPLEELLQHPRKSSLNSPMNHPMNHSMNHSMNHPMIPSDPEGSSNDDHDHEHDYSDIDSSPHKSVKSILSELKELNAHDLASPRNELQYDRLDDSLRIKHRGSGRQRHKPKYGKAARTSSFAEGGSEKRMKRSIEKSSPSDSPSMSESGKRKSHGTESRSPRMKWVKGFSRKLSNFEEASPTSKELKQQIPDWFLNFESSNVKSFDLEAIAAKSTFIYKSKMKTGIPRNILHQFLSSIVANSTLQKLSLRHCNIGDQGLLVLGTALTINQTLSTIDLRNNNLTADGIRLFATQLRKNFFLRQCFFEETGKDGFEEEVLKLKEMLLTNQENNRCMKKVGYLLNFSDRDLQMFFETMESMITKCVWVRTIYLCNCNLASLLAKKNISVKDSFPNFMLLTNLTSLSLVGNGLTELPKSIQNLNSLKNLNFSNNLITAFPEWMYGLFSLESIIGEDNQIKEIPKELVSLPHLISVNFVGNPLTKPEIPAKFSKKKGKSLGSKFLAFLREYYELCQRTHRCKIYLLGEFEDIKLNFVESIQNYCSNRKVHEPKSTAYDDSCLKVFSAVKSKRNQVPLEFLFYVMDGSPQMHPAYEYLMSGVCIPMILFPLSGNYQKMYTISAWVSLVLAISKYPIYVIYISNLDYNMHSENLSHLIPVDSRINETYINVNSQDDIKNFMDKIESNLFGLDVYKNDGLSESHMKSVPSGSISAREEIEIEKVEFTDDNIKDKRGKSSDFEIKTIKLGKENTYSALKLGEQIPMSWINLNDKIEKIRKGVVTWEEWEKMAFSCGITYKDDLIKATIYLHHTTKIRYFATILPSPNYLLVLDIKWLAKILSSLLRPPKQFQIQPDGVYRMQDLEAIWGSANDKYPVPKIVDLLIQLNIIWKEADGLFIPLLSNPIQPPLLEQYWENNNTFTIWRNYVSNFVPEGCFSLMMIKLLKVGWKRLTSWKNGAILFTPKATLRIEESGYINCCLSIILRGKDGNSLKTPLSQVASCIGKRYPDMKVPCYNCMANSIFPPNDFKMDKVPQSEEFLCGRCHFKVKREFLFPELRHSKRGWYF